MNNKTRNLFFRVNLLFVSPTLPFVSEHAVNLKKLRFFFFAGTVFSQKVIPNR